MKKNRWLRLYEVFVQLSVYPLLVLVTVMGVLTCGLVVVLAFRVAGMSSSLPASSARNPISHPVPYSPQLKNLPSPNPMASATPTKAPSPTFTALPTQRPVSSAVVADVQPATGAIPVVYPTSSAIPPPNSTFGAIPVIYPTAGSLPPPPKPTLSPSPTITPTATLAPQPEYDFMLAEFFNSSTTNNFLLIYVAIVDPKEIPIGDMKIVGVRQDHNLTYESPLSTWFYEGYSAPGEVIKSGNLKFEPPGGIESAGWVVHLEDSHGNRQSEDVSFEVDANDKQWYFIKFRRKF